MTSSRRPPPTTAVTKSTANYFSMPPHQKCLISVRLCYSNQSLSRFLISPCWICFWISKSEILTGVYLTDLTFIEDGNPEKIDGLINWGKKQMTAGVIREITLFQSTFGYQLTVCSCALCFRSKDQIKWDLIKSIQKSNQMRQRWVLGFLIWSFSRWFLVFEMRW